MKYKSTRGKVNQLSFSETVLMGLADDGGLIIPEKIPQIGKEEILRLSDLPYKELALNIMEYFIDDIPRIDLKTIINDSYSAFDTEEVIPVVSFGGNLFIGEIFHGPTHAFKDIALQFLGNLFSFILNQKGQKMNILGATSGDTGSAAIYGFKGKKDINIFILHPHGKVSPVQELQMTTVDDKNVFNIAIEGTFDDCQFIVKSIFNDLEFKKRYSLGAINSINWSRVLAQIIYYFYTYFKSTKGNDELPEVYFAVPTGNFGNIFAGYVAKKMGLPIKKLILATNENNILTRFINNGDYSLSKVVETYSPSMDIQIASNLERYLYFLYNEESEILSEKMNEFEKNKRLSFKGDELKKIQSDFVSISTSNEQTLKTIKNFYKKYSYILDPHTACAINAVEAVYNTQDIFIALATAHPAKFEDAIVKAIGIKPEEPSRIKQIKGKPKRFTILQNSIEDVKRFIQEALS
ncbi:MULTISPECIES: threonine synthase [Calditerrivibrio]|jgi:threonine synthase|uniref:Threonine synthase n=1 Tax=Calditerrivibrio nitroreducens TaxID=477976 RepID=A0A2J6WJY8_9BACT|nr:MAG: threonine synthase [Calditerrivibrio nitroreducens]